jgi:phosphatidylglycerophosphatase C
MAKKPAAVAAFDFDGTISYSDTLASFILFSVGFKRFVLNMLPLLPLFAAYLVGKRSRQQTKEKVLSRFFRGEPLSKLRELGEKFASSPQGLLKHIKPEALERIAWHRARGDRCILISANLEIYLEPWAKAHGFEATIASLLEGDENGCFTGKLLGLNCRNHEKVRRLEEHAGPKMGYTLYAYGDSDGDKELLAAADYPFYRKLK